MRTVSYGHCTKKGTNNERRCIEVLKTEGYDHIWRTIRTRFRSIDMFGAFDVVGLRSSDRHMIFVQVKSNIIEKRDYEKILSVPLPLKCPHCGGEIISREIWAWKDRVGFERVKI